jgi:phosphosulfolactate synthase (CoM biosynthesis protein A)
MDDERRFLDFLELAPRSSKPRTQGLTCIGDEGDPIPWVRNMLDSWGDYIDCVKFVPALLMMPSRVVEERVKLYRDFNLGVALDDPIFAIAYYQGKAEELLRSARDIGFTHCQIDTRHVRLDDPEREKGADEDGPRLSAMAKDLNVEGIVAEMKRLLASGCEHVFLENRVMRDAIGDYGERQEGDKQIRRIVEEVGQDNIYIEIANQMPFEARNCHRFWAVRTFGPDVNFAGGTTLKEVRYVEAIRRGVIFIPGPSKSSSRLWVNSLAKNNGKAAEEWWKEDYPIDPSVVEKLR